MSGVRVKICGITRAEDGRAAAQAGADAIGLVFYGDSPRCVDLDTAATIAREVGPFVTTVALFVNPQKEQVDQVLTAVRPQLLQFHGDEEPAFCEQFERPYLKAIRVREDTDLAGETARHPKAAGFLLDAWHPNLYGGTGRSFDWRLAQKLEAVNWVLAGGLNADNVAEAVRQAGPYGVDVSGGVESSPGIKDTTEIARFIKAARSGVS